MKKIILNIVLFFAFTITLYSQQSEKYLKLTESLKAVDSIIEIKNFRNGNPKKIEKYLIYEYGDYIYTFAYGKHQLFDKDGNVFLEEEYDRFGSRLFHRQMNSKGEVYLKIESEKIDLKPETTTKQFMDSSKFLLVTSYEKEYGNFKKNGELILWKEGKRMNRKKIGIWKTYNGCDDEVKIKNHSK